MPIVPLSAQISALEVITSRTPHSLQRAGMATRLSEAEMIRGRLIAALGTLRWLQANEPAIKAKIGDGT